MATDLLGQMLTGNEALAVDFGVGVLASCAAIMAAWPAITPAHYHRHTARAVVVALVPMAVLAPNTFFMFGKVLRGFFFNAAIPAVGWLSFLVLVLLAGALLGVLFSRHEARKAQGERADTLPSVGERIQPALTQPRAALLTGQPEPARATRQTTAITVKRGEHVR